MLKHNNFNKKHIIVVAGLILVFGAMAAGLLYRTSNSQEDVTETLQLKELDSEMTDAKLSQEGVRALEALDISAYDNDELYEHYMMLAESLMASTDYEIAAEFYAMAVALKPSEYSVHLARANAFVRADNANSAKEAYRDALEAFKSSGAEGVEDFEAYINSQIEGVETAIEYDYDTIYDGGSIEDDSSDLGGQQ